MSHITRGSDENKYDWDFKQENGIWPWETHDEVQVKPKKKKKKKKKR